MMVDFWRVTSFGAENWDSDGFDETFLKKDAEEEGLASCYI